MIKKILIIYETGHPLATASAGEIGHTLIHKQGIAVEVFPLAEVTDVKGYDAVVVGGTFHATGWTEEIAGFIAAQRDALASIPVAYFLIGEANTPGVEALRREAHQFLDTLLRPSNRVHPVSVGLFVHLSEELTPSTLAEAATGGRKGVFENWKAVREWATSLPWHTGKALHLTTITG